MGYWQLQVCLVNVQKKTKRQLGRSASLQGTNGEWPHAVENARSSKTTISRKALCAKANVLVAVAAQGS